MENDNEVQCALPKNHPCIVAWIKYQGTTEFKNSKAWAAKEQYRLGALWAVFEAGYNFGKQAK